MARHRGGIESGCAREAPGTRAPSRRPHPVRDSPTAVFAHPVHWPAASRAAPVRAGRPGGQRRGCEMGRLDVQRLATAWRFTARSPRHRRCWRRRSRRRGPVRLWASSTNPFCANRPVPQRSGRLLDMRIGVGALYHAHLPVEQPPRRSALPCADREVRVFIPITTSTGAVTARSRAATSSLADRHHAVERIHPPGSRSWPTSASQLAKVPPGARP